LIKGKLLEVLQTTPGQSQGGKLKPTLVALSTKRFCPRETPTFPPPL
jgi:hypothetical protein